MDLDLAIPTRPGGRTIRRARRVAAPVAVAVALGVALAMAPVLAGCTDASPRAPTETGVASADSPPIGAHARWPGVDESLVALVETPDGIRRVTLEPLSAGPVRTETPDGSTRSRHDPIERVFAAACDSCEEPLRDRLADLRVRDRLTAIDAGVGTRLVRELLVDGWRPGLELVVVVPVELLGRESAIRVNGALLETGYERQAVEIPLSRDEATVLEWTAADDGNRRP